MHTKITNKGKVTFLGNWVRSQIEIDEEKEKIDTICKNDKKEMITILVYQNTRWRSGR